MTQKFRFLALNEKIVEMRPHNPFANGVIEQINNQPIDQQLSFIKEKLLTPHNITSTLEVVGINADYNAVMYDLTLTKT